MCLPAKCRASASPAGGRPFLVGDQLVRNKGPWKNIDDLEIAIAEYIDWFNYHRLRGEIGLVPPVEQEDTYYRHNTAPTPVGASVPSLHRTGHETPVIRSPAVADGQAA
jgi:hypothetical protein